MGQCVIIRFIHAVQLEKGTANASYFLPGYDLKQCTASVADLKQRIEAARAELLPKKKFAFSNAKKLSRVKGAEMSTAAAEANPLGATPVSAGGTSAVAGAALLKDRQGAGGTDGGGNGGADDAQDGADGSAAGPHSTPAAEPSQQDIALVKAGHGLMGLRNQVRPLLRNHRQLHWVDLGLRELRDDVPVAFSK